MSFKDYYKILGLETNKVNIEQIKLAYREQAKKYHPDMHIGDDFSEEKFKEVNEAYKILSDNKSKRRYDRSWYIHKDRIERIKNREQEEKMTFKEKLVKILFGITSNKKVSNEKVKTILNGENIETEVDVTIIEAFYGVKKKLKLLAVDGKTKVFNLDIPAGIQNNDKIRFVGQGKPGKNGGKNGDLLVKIKIKDTKDLKLKGSNLFKEIKIAPWEAALGTEIKVNTLDEDITLIIPKGTQSGEDFIIKEKGYKIGKGKRGDLHIITKIFISEKLSNQEIKLYEKLRDLHDKTVKMVINE